MAVSHHVVGGDEIRAALHTILASETFTRSQQLSRLLKYLCDSLLANGPDYIAEYTIGTEALGRPADFDPNQDSVVRVEMHRLRRRLRDYYQAEGMQDPVRIVIPPGQYAPVVTRTWEEHPTTNGSTVEIHIAEDPPSEHPVVLAAEALPPGQGHKIPPRQFALISVALVVVLLSVWLFRPRPGSAGTSGSTDTSKGTFAIPSSSPLAGVRIGCGRHNSWTDRLGQIWGADEHFEGGQAIEIPGRSYIAGAFDARLYQSARTGSFSYKVPLPARDYELRLYFIEPVYGPQHDQGGEANRLFTVSINGEKVLDRFDIVSDADGPWTANVRVFKDIIPGPDGYVRIDFASINDAALLNAIEFLPARRHTLNPIRLLPQDNFYTDSAGNLWTPDNYSRGGRVAIHPGPVKNTHDQEIFRHERYGHFRYTIPVDRGSYSVYMYLAELYWGPGNPGGGGGGTRLFSVFCNGVPLLRNIDLFKEVGVNYGVVRGFHHLTPNAQGKLTLSFEPEHDYASLYALEVIDEAGPDTPSYERTMTGAARN